jgi:transposase
MAFTEGDVTGGVDTHSQTHHAAVIDATGRHLADRRFHASKAGEAELVAWLGSHGRLVKVGVEGTGSYGACLTRQLTAQGAEVVEVDRPDRKARRREGKSDPLDAYAAATAALCGRASGAPKTRTGPVEGIRARRVARDGAVKARTAALNSLHALVVTAPEDLREALRTLPTADLVARTARLRPDLTDPTSALEQTKAAMRLIARRIVLLTEEITDHDKVLDTMTATVAPRTRAIHGVGPHVAAQLLITAGDNPERITTDAKLAHLCGVAPIPASSGKTERHRLNKGGDRAANSALHTIVLTRMATHQPTRDYVTRRTTKHFGKLAIMRCLKRAVTREVHRALLADFTSLTT